VYTHILISAKLQIGKRGQKSVLTRKRPLRRRYTLDCGAIEEEEEEVEEEKEKEKEEEEEEDEEEGDEK